MKRYEGLAWTESMAVDLDYNYAMADLVRERGLHLEEMEALTPRLAAIQADVEKGRQEGRLAFYELPYQLDTVKEIRRVATQAEGPEEVDVPFVKRHALTLGIALMFLLTWPFYAQLGLLVGYGLSIACLIVTGLAEGRAGIGSLLRRFLRWRVAIGWYIAALGGPLMLYASALALYFLAGGEPVSSANSLAANLFGPSDYLWLYFMPFLLVDALSNGEELAWRGFVLPRYQARFSALLSSLFLGILWGIWQLPRYLPSGDAGFGLEWLGLRHFVRASMTDQRRWLVYKIRKLAAAWPAYAMRLIAGERLTRRWRAAGVSRPICGVTPTARHLVRHSK